MKSIALLLLLIAVAVCVAQEPTPRPPRYSLKLLGGKGTGAVVRQAPQPGTIVKTVDELKRVIETMPSGSVISFNWHSDMKLESEIAQAHTELKTFCEQRGITLSFMAAPFI